MASAQRRARTTGSAKWEPDQFFDSWGSNKQLPKDHDLRTSIISAFNLSDRDSYVYHAIASVNLSEVQEAISNGSENGLHAWYLDGEGKALPPPPKSDVVAYTSMFSSTASSTKALTALAANAKKDSHRARVAQHLQGKRLLPKSHTVSKLKKPQINPYYDYWCWSCENLEWAGPEAGTVDVKTSHHMLPVFMHHFGCVVPSYEGLEIIKKVARDRPIVEVGSGNGYWAYMLRRMGLKVSAIDNLQSEYRTLWISDTITRDGESYLQGEKGAKEAVLLLVYPIVGLDFTAKILKAYKGSTICIAGTQNRNGYTAFKDRTIGEYVVAEKPEFQKTVQIPLPSFAGKDEALFIFEKETAANT